MPVFNQRIHFFRDAVESVLRQSYTTFKLIIVDDGSTDSKLIDLMESYSKDLRVLLVKNAVNKGVAFSLNVGI
jgi:glycosyltransferase involved in cell wall biosynthesis